MNDNTHRREYFKQDGLYEIIILAGHDASRIRFSRNVQSLVLDVRISKMLDFVSLFSRRKFDKRREFPPQNSAVIKDYHPKILSLIICYPDESNDNGYRNIETNAKAESTRGEMCNYRASIRFIFFRYSK